MRQYIEEIKIMHGEPFLKKIINIVIEIREKYHTHETKTMISKNYRTKKKTKPTSWK